MAYDVIVVGAGASGIFTSLFLIEENPNLKVLLLDKGKPLEDRDRKQGKDLMEGWGGAGSFSDGKLVFSTDREYGGNLQEYIHDMDLFGRLMRKVDDIYMRFSNEKNIRVYGDDEEKIEAIKTRAARCGLHLLSAKIRHLGTDNNYDILDKMYAYLKDKVEIRFHYEVVGCNPADAGFEVQYKDLQNLKEGFERSPYLVMAPGRRG